MPRGRKPKPTIVKQLNGNPGKRALNVNEPRAEGALGPAPAHFTPAQVALWNEALVEAPKGLLTIMDAAPLEAYCIWRCHFNDAQLGILQHGLTVTDPKTGERKAAPEIGIQGKATDKMLKACAELGFTPSSRGRINFEAPQGTGNEFGDV